MEEKRDRLKQSGKKDNLVALHIYMNEALFLSTKLIYLSASNLIVASLHKRFPYVIE